MLWYERCVRRVQSKRSCKLPSSNSCLLMVPWERCAVCKESNICYCGGLRNRQQRGFYTDTKEYRGGNNRCLSFSPNHFTRLSPRRKSLKASFSNWWLKLCNERGNLGLLRTLRNRAGSATMTTMRKLVQRNGHVKNKDRQDPAAVLTLCSEDLTSFLSNVGYVCHTIIPELDKFTENNRLGMYPSPIGVAVGKYGWLLFLT